MEPIDVLQARLDFLQARLELLEDCWEPTEFQTAETLRQLKIDTARQLVVDARKCRDAELWEVAALAWQNAGDAVQEAACKEQADNQRELDRMKGQR